MLLLPGEKASPEGGGVRRGAETARGARRRAWAEMQELLSHTHKEREGRIEETLAWTPFQYTH